MDTNSNYSDNLLPDNASPPPRSIDWAAIQLVYTTTSDSTRDIGRSHGVTHAATHAYADAAKATYDGHFDYSSNNRPRVMQGNAARVLLLFKQFGQNMVYTLARQAQQSLKGATPKERAEARKALGGLLAMHGMAAGVLGLPSKRRDAMDVGRFATGDL